VSLDEDLFVMAREDKDDMPRKHVMFETFPTSSSPFPASTINTNKDSHPIVTHTPHHHHDFLGTSPFLGELQMVTPQPMAPQSHMGPSPTYSILDYIFGSCYIVNGEVVIHSNFVLC